MSKKVLKVVESALQKFLHVIRASSLEDEIERTKKWRVGSLPPESEREKFALAELAKLDRDNPFPKHQQQKSVAALLAKHGIHKDKTTATPGSSGGVPTPKPPQKGGPTK